MNKAALRGPVIHFYKNGRRVLCGKRYKKGVTPVAISLPVFKSYGVLSCVKCWKSLKLRLEPLRMIDQIKESDDHNG